MLIGYSMPKVTGVSQYAGGGGAGSAWLTSDNGSAAVDGKPARRSRLQWLTSAPAIGHFVGIPLDLAAATTLRVVAFLGLRNVPAGTKVMVYGKRTGDAATTYNFTGSNQGSVVRLADGTFGAWIVLPSAAEPVVRVEFRFYNDVAGATWATAATTIDVGELVAMPAVDIEIEREWQDELVDPSVSAFSVAAQPATVRRQAYRVLTATLTVDGVAKVRAGALANGMDWYTLRTAMLSDQRVVAIPRWKTIAGAIDSAELHRTALYGVGRMGGSQHAGGDYYGAGLTFQEVPATP